MDIFLPTKYSGNNLTKMEECQNKLIGIRWKRSPSSLSLYRLVLLLKACPYTI